MKKLIFIIGVFLLCSFFVSAEDVQTYDIAYGEDVTIEFKGWGIVDLKVREGTNIDFNVVDTENNLIIEEIGMKTKGKISVNSRDYEDFEIELGEEKQVDLTEKVPFILIEERIFHDAENVEDKIITLRFRYPFMSSTEFNEKFGEEKLEENKSSEENESEITGKVVEDKNKDLKQEKDPYLKYYIGAIIILLLILILLGPKKKKDEEPVFGEEVEEKSDAEDIKEAVEEEKPKIRKKKVDADEEERQKAVRKKAKQAVKKRAKK